MARLANDGYFDKGTWKERLDDWIGNQPAAASDFLFGNRDSITRCLTHHESGLRMVVNISADALLSFLSSGDYLNAYRLPPVAGKVRGPSPRRQWVDATLQLDPPEDFYFGAAAMGGTGVRFYGEYCMALKPEQIDPATRVLDRNSYDLLYPPLAGRPDLPAIVNALKGGWDADAVSMLVRRVLPDLVGANRLVTLGTVSDAILHDEDFLEIHKRGSFTPTHLEEIRETPEDQAIEAHILSQFDYGQLPRISELLWVMRRDRVAHALARHDLRTRVVASSGRGSRWD